MSVFSSISDEDLETFLKDLQTAYLTGKRQATFQGMTVIYSNDAELRRKMLEVQAEIDSRLPGNESKKKSRRVYIQTTDRGF